MTIIESSFVLGGGGLPNDMLLQNDKEMKEGMLALLNLTWCVQRLHLPL